MTDAQIARMYETLTRIARGYQTPKQLRRSSEREYGLSYDEALECSYENIQEEARQAIKGVRIKKATLLSAAEEACKENTNGQ